MNKMEEYLRKSECETITINLIVHVSVARRIFIFHSFNLLSHSVAPRVCVCVSRLNLVRILFSIYHV